jgi:hypothetical protein
MSDKVGTEHAAGETANPSNPSDPSNPSTSNKQEVRINPPAASSDVTGKSEASVPARELEKETAHSHHEVEEDEGAHYVHGAARIALVFGLCITTFLVGLDNLIIATAIPKITTLFHSLEDVGWYG